MAVASTVRGPSPNTDVSPDTTVLPAPDPDNPGIGQARRSPISCSACWHAVAGEVHDLCPIGPKIMPLPFRRASHDVTTFLAPRGWRCRPAAAGPSAAVVITYGTADLHRCCLVRG